MDACLILSATQKKKNRDYCSIQEAYVDIVYFIRDIHDYCDVHMYINAVTLTKLLRKRKKACNFEVGSNSL